jgi:hypothetical protein
LNDNYYQAAILDAGSALFAGFERAPTNLVNVFGRRPKYSETIDLQHQQCSMGYIYPVPWCLAK